MAEYILIALNNLNRNISQTKQHTVIVYNHYTTLQHHIMTTEIWMMCNETGSVTGSSTQETPSGTALQQRVNSLKYPTLYIRELKL